MAEVVEGDGGVGVDVGVGELQLALRERPGDLLQDEASLEGFDWEVLLPVPELVDRCVRPLLRRDGRQLPYLFRTGEEEVFVYFNYG